MTTPDLNSYKWVQFSIYDSTPLSTRESHVINRVAEEDFCFRGHSYRYPDTYNYYESAFRPAECYTLTQFSGRYNKEKKSLL